MSQLSHQLPHQPSSQQHDNLIVKVGMLISLVLMLTISFSLNHFIPEIEGNFDISARISLAIKACILPSLMLIIGVLIVGASRFGNESQDPTKVEAATDKMKINLRCLENTLEQLIIFVINILGLAVLLPQAQLQWLIIYSVLFVCGRGLFWLGYHINVLYRAPGFGMTFVPSIVAALTNTVLLITNIQLH